MCVVPAAGSTPTAHFDAVNAVTPDAALLSLLSAGVITCTVVGLATVVRVEIPPASSAVYANWSPFPAQAAPLLSVQFWVEVCVYACVYVYLCVGGASSCGQCTVVFG